MLFRKLRLDWRYGISELLIVVAGVLIALAADDWRQTRELRLAEQGAFSRLASDMQADVREFEGNRMRTRRGYEAAIWLMERRYGPAPPLDSLSAKITDFTACSSFSPTIAEYTALKSSGTISNLRDADFRERMVNHYEEYPWVSGLYEDDCRFVEEGIVAIESHIELGLDETGAGWPIVVIGDAAELLRNPTFQRTVGFAANMRLFLAPHEEGFIAELGALRERALELSVR